ncbi:TPA: ABC transporter substrate-binding protein [Enterococcus faecium]|uniref:ABC transporter substrate-binding protein n=1 Tax=Enterococcus TaxID=1350 RepID=UPI0021AB30A1|nr:sugar ABC transporter substrate-binding protein [Enterococcus faecium]
MKKIAKISIMAAALMVLGGCGNNSESSESDKTLTVLVEGGSPAEKVAKETAAEFKKESGYEVKIDSVPYSGVYDKLKAEIDAKKATHDAAIIDVLWFPALAKGLSPVSDVITQEQMDDFLPQLDDSATIDGELLGLPTWTNSKILLYRKDLFEDEANKKAFSEKYGYDLTVPKTWQEYKDAAEFFTKDDMYGTSVFGQTGGDAVSSWLDLAAQAGAKPLIMDDNNKILINEKPYVESLEYLQSLIKNKSVPEDYLSIASTETAELFNNQKLAMQIAWGHFYLTSEEALPGKVGAAPALSGSAGVGAVPGPWYQVILKDSKKKDVAEEYLAFMYDKNELYMDALGIAGRKSVFEKYANNEDYAHIDAISETLDGPQTQNRPKIAEWTQIENEVLSPMLQRVLSGEDAQKELDAAKTEIENIMSN